MVKLVQSTFIILFFSSQLLAQKVGSLQSYTPSVLIKQRGFELKVFNNLYTQTNDQAFYTRNTYYSNFVQFLYGSSQSRRLNVGFDVVFKGVRNDSIPKSPFAILGFEQYAQSRYGFTAAGPKIKFVPFKNVTGLSVQSAFWIPLARGSEGTPWLDFERYTSWTQIFYDRKLSEKFRMFAELDSYILLGKRFETNKFEFRTPASLIVSYFPTTKITLYVLNQFSPTLSSWAFFYQAGVGTKYQFTDKFEIELLYTDFLASKNAGRGETFNLGIRLLK